MFFPESFENFIQNIELHHPCEISSMNTFIHVDESYSHDAPSSAFGHHAPTPSWSGIHEFQMLNMSIYCTRLKTFVRIVMVITKANLKLKMKLVLPPTTFREKGGLATKGEGTKVGPGSPQARIGSWVLI